MTWLSYTAGDRCTALAASAKAKPPHAALVLRLVELQGCGLKSLKKFHRIGVPLPSSRPQKTIVLGSI